MLGKKIIDNLFKKAEELKLKIAIARLDNKLENSMKSILVQFRAMEEKVNGKVNQIDRIKVDVEKKLNEFYKEFTNRYFDSLQSIFKWQKEISLASYIVKKTEDKELVVLRQKLLQPMLEKKWAYEKTEEDKRIDKILTSKGEEIRKKREELKQAILKAEREERPAERLKIQLNIINEMVGDK